MQRSFAPRGFHTFGSLSSYSVNMLSQRRWSASGPAKATTTGTSSGNASSHATNRNASASPSVPPSAFSSAQIASMLSSPELTREVIIKLSESKRRELLVAASYYEWFGDEEADLNQTNAATTTSPPRGQSAFLSNSPTPEVASSHESDTHNHDPIIITDCNDNMNFSWDDMRRRHREKRKKDEELRAREELREAHPMPTFPMTQVEYNEWIRDTVQTMNAPAGSSKIPFKVLLKVAIQTGLPFLAFGTLDNSMLILAGDMLDNLVGAELKLSPMGAAAMGGIVSGVVGIQIHGLAERAVNKYGPPPPALKPSQWRSKPLQSAIHWGGTFGLVCGLLVGMFPLLLISDSSSVRRALDAGDD